MYERAVRAALLAHDVDALRYLGEGPVESLPLDVLHALLREPGHHWHQRVVMAIQVRADPASVPVLVDAIERGFEPYEFTCSETGVIAKWFSHALAAIGTPDALLAIRRYATHIDPEIAEEMAYRLHRLGGSPGRDERRQGPL